MAISDTIQSMYENVGEVYDTITNVTLPEHKNIENIPRTIRDSYLEIMNNGIEVVWENWEKVTGEGTSLTLTPTEEAPMQIVYKGNTSQEGTPTPDYPQDIHVVSGDNSIEVCGKNLIDIEEYLSYAASYTKNSDGSYTFATTTSLYNEGMPVNFSQEFTISYSLLNVTGTNFGIRCGFADGYQLDVPRSGSSTTEYYNATYKVTQSTLDNHGNVTSLRGNWSNAGTFTIKDLMIEYGEKTSYIPYTGASYHITLPEGMELCKIGTYQDKIDKSTGKNLWNEEWTIGKGITASNGAINDNTNGAISDYIPVDFNKNPNYYISGLTNTLSSFIGAYNSNKEFLGRTGGSARTEIGLGTYSFSSGTPQGTGDIAYIVIYQYKQPSDSGAISIVDTINVMLNIGSTALPYEPYGTSWYLKKEIGKVILDGSEDENWSSNLSVSTNGLLNRAANSDFQDTNVYMPHAPYMSDIFKYIGNAGTLNVTKEGLYNTSSTGTSRLYVWIDKERLTESTISAFRTFLSNNPMTLYYILATPTYTLIEGELLNQLEAIKMSYEGQTNISQDNNDLPFILTANALEKV